MDWIPKCEDKKLLRQGMKNAKAKNRDDIYWQAFKRLCELEGRDMDDPLERDFHSTLTAYEELLTAKNGRTTKASRTRQKLNNKSVVECLEDWAVASTPTEGFKLLVDAGLVSLTGEYLVLKYPDKFTPKAIDHARRRLKEVGWQDQ